MAGLTASFSPKGETLAVAACNRNADSGQLILYNASNLQKAAGFRAGGGLTSLAFMPGGSLLFMGGYDGAIRVMDTQSALLVATLFRSTSGEWVVFTPDGLYDASTDGARLLGWRTKGQIVLASELPGMRRSGLLSMLIGGKRPKPDKALSLIIPKVPQPNR